MGQFVLYQNALSILEPDRALFLAIREAVYVDLFEEAIGQLLLQRNLLQIVSFDPDQEVIIRWIT